MITRRSFIAGSATLALSAGGCSALLAASMHSDSQLIYGYPPGATGSKLANALTSLLAAQGGPTYRLTSMQGRNTRTASIAVARAVPDGTFMLQALSTSLTLMPSLYKEMGFDPVGDFKPIASVADFPYVLVLGPLVPNTVTNVSEYIAWTKNNPDFCNIGISVNGSAGELAVQTLANTTDAPLFSQAYQGTYDMLKDLQSQALAAAFVVPNQGINPDLNAPIRPIGITSSERFSFWPHVMPLAEQGIPDLKLSAWFGWFTQSSTPESELISVRAAIIKMQSSQGYADVLKGLLLTASPLSASQITARMNEETDRYQRLVEKLGMKKLS
jgi:tripartite-type tricarboxylate transporter receptor subunit TctC